MTGVILARSRVEIAPERNGRPVRHRRNDEAGPMILGCARIAACVQD
jgi:hypothetical protein